jgi:hypothetical protein
VLSDDRGHRFTATTSRTSVDISKWDRARLTIIPSSDADFTLSVTATAALGRSSSVLGRRSATSRPATEQVTVSPPAPTLAPVTASGVEGGAIGLDLGVAIQGRAGEGNSLSSLVVGAIPLGAVLSDGHGHSFTASAGSTAVDLVGWTLAGLSITPAGDKGFTLGIAATEKDAEGTASTVASGTLDVTVLPGAKQPVLNVQAAAGNEGTAIPLTISAAQADDTLSPLNLSVTIAGLQGATLNHGTLNADGSYTLGAADLAGLVLTPAASSAEL